MRYDAGHKERTHERLLTEAVRTIRTEGVSALGVSGLMARAGLTNGGFYAHFRSREDLVAAAVDQMFGGLGDMLDRRTAGLTPTETLRAYVRSYLSRAHRDALEGFCPLPVLAGDLPRLDARSRARYDDGVARLTERVAALLGAHGNPDAETSAASLLAEMIGALALARGVSGREQSDAILRHSRSAIIERFNLGETVQ